MAKCWGSAGNPSVGAWDFTVHFYLHPLKHWMPLGCSLKVEHGRFCHNEWGFLLAWQCLFWVLWILSPPVSGYWVVLKMLDDVPCSGSHHVLISSCPCSLLPLTFPAVTKGGKCLQDTATMYSFRLFHYLLLHLGAERAGNVLFPFQPWAVFNERCFVPFQVTLLAVWYRQCFPKLLTKSKPEAWNMKSCCCYVLCLFLLEISSKWCCDESLLVWFTARSLQGCCACFS